MKSSISISTNEEEMLVIQLPEAVPYPAKKMSGTDNRRGSEFPTIIPGR